MASVAVSVHKSAGTAVAGPGRLPLRLGSPNPGLYGAAILCLKADSVRGIFRVQINCPPLTGRTSFGARRRKRRASLFLGLSRRHIRRLLRDAVPRTSTAER